MTNTTAIDAEQFWSDHLDRIERDATTVAAYARVHELSAASLYGWRGRIARRRQRATASRFAELVPASTVPVEPVAASSMVIELGTARLTFDALPDAAWLGAMVRAAQPPR